jgi:hypothetical protein
MGGLRREYTMLEFLFFMPFNVFVWTIKYFGSLLVWVGIVVWVWSYRTNVWDGIVDSVYWCVDKIKSVYANRR